MRSAINQRMIEKAIRASSKAGHLPTSVECHPDGKIVLCFGQGAVGADDALDREMTEWKRANATS